MKYIDCPFPFLRLFDLFSFREVYQYTQGLVLLVRCLSESRLLGTRISMDNVPNTKTSPSWAYRILKSFL